MEAHHLISLKIIFLLTLMVVASPVSGQNLETTRNAFALSFSKNSLELSRGENGELEIQVLKSRGYRKSKIKMGVSSSLPKGVAITFSPDNDSFDSTKANILIQADATPGQYLLILNATLNNKTKGTILKLFIN